MIRFDDIPPAKRREVCHTSVVCEIRADKDGPNRTRITIAGGRIVYHGDVATRTGGLELHSQINDQQCAFEVRCEGGML